MQLKQIWLYSSFIIISFLGNDNIHEITSIGDYELRIDLQDWDGQTWYAIYKSFRVGDESTKYTLSLGSYTGTAGRFSSDWLLLKYFVALNDKNYQ